VRYLSLFSGIEAASVAWQDMGWDCVGFSEIDKFPSEVLNQRHPNIPNLGDITKITNGDLDALGTTHLVVGGSPCQSFSIGGQRGGLEDPRGQLMLEYIRVVERLQPKWFLWENVVGVLSADDGRAFGTLLREMANLGYSLCWRVLDTQNFGVPQRRRRVYLVGHIGTDRECAAKVLFDPYRRNRCLEEIKGTEQNTAGENEGSSYCDVYNGLMSEVAPTMTTATGTSNGSGPKLIQTAYTMSTFSGWSEGYGSLCASDYKRPHAHISVVGDRIRRLTPVECERLQGFPDNYTRIKWRGKDEENCPISLRYKALGNSMSVPVMKWIGHNIREYDERYYLPW